jgi:hypothetical protein
MAIRCLVYTAVLYAALVHNVFCVQEDMLTVVGEFRSGYMTGDDTLVINRMRSPDDGPFASMVSWSPGIWTPYRSQFGLTGVLFAAAQRATGASPERVAAVGSASYGLLTAALLGAFFSSVAARIAPAAGHIGVLLTACSPPLLVFAPSIYWTLPATLAPFVFAWIAYPWAEKSTTRMLAFLAAEAVLVGLKCLCGYEYVSTVVAAPAAAIVFHRAAASERWRTWILPVMGVGAAGVLGFAVAVGIHAFQLSSQTGENGLDLIRSRAASRTLLPNGEGVEKVIYPVFAPESLPQPVRCFITYFHQPILSSPQTWGGYRFTVSLGMLLAALAPALAFLRRGRGDHPAAAALVPASVVALLAGVSWQMLAVNHMVFHGHLNLVVYCVPFAPVAFAAIGSVVARAGWSHGATGLLVAAAVGIVAWNALVLGERAREREDLDSAARERVEELLRSGATAAPRGDRGPAPILGPLPLDPAELPNVAVFTPKYAPAVADDERPIGVYGWIGMPRERTSRIPMAVVCVRGSEIIPVRVGYFRLASVERIHNKQMSCVAFHVVIPPPHSAAPLRLFAVPADPARPVVELTAPGG